jgi:hypothetical protein
MDDDGVLMMIKTTTRNMFFVKNIKVSSTKMKIYHEMKS